DGTFTYTPGAGEEGTVTFDYTITDGDGDVSTATVTITLQPDSTPTISVAGDNTVDEEALADGSNPASPDETATGTIPITTGSDSVASLVINGVDVTAGGTVTTAKGVLTVTVSNGSYGYSYTLTDNTLTDPDSDTFSLTVTDSDGDSAGTSLVIAIVDDVPTAVDDAATQGAENTAITVDVLANDTPGADGVADSAVAAVAGSLSGTGTLAYNGDGTFTYTPGSGEEGTVTFDYTITDGDGDVSQATVTITLTPDSTPTISVAGDNTVDEEALADGSNPASPDETATGTIPITTGSDSVASLVINGVDVTAGGTVTTAKGVLTVTVSNGIYSYSYTLTDNTLVDPDSDTFSLTVTDSDGDSAGTSLVIAIVDDVPTAVDDSASQGTENAAITVDVLANDVPGADGVATSAVAAVAGSLSGTGTLAYNGDGTFTYTPGAGEEGTVTFDYTITDGDGDVSTATVTITLSPDSTPTISV
ncbi:Ig-like domain-containing protein, partial [Aurantiacibacter luteus]